jgi:hypothetical protein
MSCHEASHGRRTSPRASGGVMPRAGRRCRQVLREPLAGILCDLIERAGLLEEVGGAGDDDELVLDAQQGCGLAVHLDDGHIPPAHDEQGRGLHIGEAVCGQVGPAPA